MQMGDGSRATWHCGLLSKLSVWPVRLVTLWPKLSLFVHFTVSPTWRVGVGLTKLLRCAANAQSLANLLPCSAPSQVLAICIPAMEPDVSVEEDEVDDDGEEQPATARESFDS